MLAEAGRTTILIADDHPIFLHGLRRVLQETTSFAVVAEASTGAQTITLAAELRPHVTLLDFDLPDMPATEIVRQLSEREIETRVVLLAATIERKQVLDLLQLGARGVIGKDSPIEIVSKSIQAVLTGEYWVGRDVMADWVQQLKHGAPRGSITAREREVIQRALQGLANRDIAAALKISEETVKRHISNIYDKLGVSNRMELALYVSAGKLNHLG